MFLHYLQLHIPNLWQWFIMSFALVLITSLMMRKQSRHFYTIRIIRLRFSILDLEFPASAKSLKRLITGIDALPDPEGKQVKKALTGQLYVDFLFMLGCYPSIFLLCMYTSTRMDFTGRYIFVVLAWLQLLAWFFDIKENIYLLQNINNPSKLYDEKQDDDFPANVQSNKNYSTYQRIVKSKWILAIIGTIGSLFALLFFWISGDYKFDKLYILGLILIEIILFVVISASGHIVKNKT